MKFLKSKWTIGVIVIIILAVGGYFLFFRHKTTYQFITAKSGSITETVSLTGNTVPEQSVSLAFASSGIIAQTYFDLGDQVQSGQVLAELNTNDLEATLHQAQADVDEQQATLEGLQSGAGPTDVALYEQQYTNASSALVIAMNNAYLQSESAVLNYADTLFTNADSANPTINVKTQDQAVSTSINEERVAVGDKLLAWKNSLAQIDTTATDTSAISQVYSVDTDSLLSVNTFLSDLSNIISNLSVGSQSTPQTTIDADQASINSASQLVNTGASAVQSAYSTWTSAEQTLISEESPSKPDDLKAQTAAVEAAQANVDSAQANLQNAEIIAPISGTITQFDAKIGESASPSTPLVSIISDSGYEVDAGVSETDVGKISVGDVATMTLDAFPNQTFTGSVFYVAPSETDTQGVITYLIKISINKTTVSLKSGLTANINIATSQKNNVLILPQYAILQNDNGTFVETLKGGTVTTTPVTLGIQDQNGNVEILSGVTEGEQVINIGLKS